MLAMFATAFLPLFLEFAFCSDDRDWCYRGKNGPSEWGIKFPNCSEDYNNRQSPIDLPSSTNGPGMISTNLTVVFSGYEKTLSNSIIRNTGKTIEIIPNAEEYYDLYPEGNSDLSFCLENIHFHWGSEHTVDGRRYPLEAHFVHRNRNYSTMEEALDNIDGVAVIAVFYSPCYAGTSSPLSNIAESLKNIKYAHTESSFSLGIPLSSLLPQGDRCFYGYQGSLTTPGCNPVVAWVIYLEVQGITYDELDKFYGVYESEEYEEKKVPLINNYRPEQLRNGRPILYHLDCEQ